MKHHNSILNPANKLIGDERVIAAPEHYLPIEPGFPECADGRTAKNRSPRFLSIRHPAAGYGLLGARATLETAKISGAVVSDDLLVRMEKGEEVIPRKDLSAHDETCRRIAHEMEALEAQANPTPQLVARLKELTGLYARMLGVTRAQFTEGLNSKIDTSRRQLRRMEDLGVSSQHDLLARIGAVGLEGCITDMTGEPTARSYLTIHAPGITLDKTKADAASTAFYVVTPASTALHVQETWGLTKPELGIVGSSILSDALVTEGLLRHALAGTHPLTGYETVQTSSGLSVARLSSIS